MKKILLVLAVVILCRTSFAQENETKHYVGINVGYTTGVGLSYRYWPKKIGLQVTTLPLYSKDSTYGSIGLTCLLKIKQFDNEFFSSRFLFYASHQVTNFFGGRSAYHPAKLMGEDRSWVYNAGFGFGFDIGNGNVVLNLMLGYAVLDITDNIKTRPVVESGMFYRF
jgi:hypothetical protein